jgi:hypothetical protein
MFSARDSQNSNTVTWEAAIDALRLAVLLGPHHPESFFNLALVQKRRGMLAEAEQETLAVFTPGSRATGRPQHARRDLRPVGETRTARPRNGVSYFATRRTMTQRAPTWRSSTASELLPRPIPH